ncbi:MAG: WYL domain-containing protein [Firmicutes bacterium]|nr:WYL domain-containing protein [Bacillota bacterium]
MAKKNTHKTEVLKYLREHPNENIPRSTLTEKIKTPKSSLSEVLKSIREDGYTLYTPPRSGIVRLETNKDTAPLPFEDIKQGDVRKWLILFLLSKYGKLTFYGLVSKTLYLLDASIEANNMLNIENSKKAYTDSELNKIIQKSIKNMFTSDTLPSVSVLRKDLSELRKSGFVCEKREDHFTYSLSEKAPITIPIDADRLWELNSKLEDTTSVITDITPLENITDKIRLLIDTDRDNINRYRFGRSNEITDEQIQTFNKFTAHPYRSKCLKLKSLNFPEEDMVAVGLLFYSVETSCFYALAENITQGRIRTYRLDNIEKIYDTEEDNTIYQSPKYYRIFQEMFSAQYEDKIHNVKVYFQDFGNVYKRFEDLDKLRNTSNIRKIDDPPQDCPYKYVYEDNLRGLLDFARYLRSFGTAVLAAEPKELRERMLITYNRILEKYGVENG